jgi:NAD(P)-dependent dehydrogenase (short-subunit alcohol dehydrogenase family)
MLLFWNCWEWHLLWAKAALMAMAHCLALEVAKINIRVNCICPSYLYTSLSDAAGIRDAMEERKSLHPLRIGTVNDVAAKVRFFASDESQWINGQSIILDGGYTTI